MSQEVKRAPFKEIFGWCMFDFANSSYTTVIISVIYCDVFIQLVNPRTNSANPFEIGNFYWGISLAISYLLVVITGPYLGAVMDFTSLKKRFLFLSYVGCILLTAALYFVNPGDVLLVCVLLIFSNFFFASGENFASSFLPFLGPQKDLGKISGYAWGVGYFGGLASVILVSTLGEIKIENYANMKFVGIYTAVFFLLAGIPTFLFLKEYSEAQIKPAHLSYGKIALVRVSETLKNLPNFKDMAIFLTALFFAMAALGIVISFAFTYGSQEIQIENKHRQAMFVLLQFSAAGGAVIFGLLQDRLGAKKTFNITLVMWVLLVMMIYFVKDITAFLNGVTQKEWDVKWVFVTISVLAGLGMGATQSASRAIVAMFSPEEKSGEFFGLWGFSGKLAAAFGLLILAYLQTIVSLRNSFLVVAVFFFAALVVNLFVDEKRGIENAKKFVSNS